MNILRQDIIPVGGTLTVRYMAIGMGAEHTLEIRADREGVEIDVQCTLSYEDTRALIDLLTSANHHHARLKNYGEVMPGVEVPCVVEYEDRTKMERE